MAFLELSAKQRLVLLAIFVGWALDAFSSGLISFSLTPMSNDLMIGTADKGAILVAWPVGMLVGAFVFGYVADLYGRKPIILLSLVLMGIFGGLTAVVSSPIEAMILRFLGGLGASTYMAVGSTLLAEYMPTKQRGRAVAVAESSWAIGWLAASLISFLVIPEMGWRVGMGTGFLTLLAVPFVLFLVPESAMYLESKGMTDASRKLREEFGLVGASRASRASVADLLGKRFRTPTVMLWVHWFAIALAYWGTFLWLPSMLQLRGLSLMSSLQNSILITLVQVPGYISGAMMIERTGRRATLAAYMAVSGLASYLLAHVVTQQDAMIWACLFSFFNLGAWGITYAYTPELYPTAVRATGAGWANAAGRIGSIAGPYMLGLLLSYGDQETAFIAFSAVQVISALAVALLGRETMGKELEG